MPYNDEKSLTVDEVYAVTAYVLYLNRIVELNQVLSDKNLADVNMPNRGGFIELQE
jgi:S-disulfanyl-L-cysteine oxidoreductase SoxD